MSDKIDSWWHAGPMALRSILVAAVLTAAAGLATACNGDAMTLGNDAGSDVAADLDGRTFLFQSAEGFTPVTGTTVRVSFQQNGFGFSAGCNGHGGSYRLDDSRLIVEDLSSTNIGCDAPLHEQDEWLADFFTSSPTLTLDGNDLTIENPAAALVFLDREVADPDRALTGRTWTVDSLIMGAVAQGGFEANPTLVFDESTVQVFTGCNTGEGEYSVSGSTLTLMGIAYTEAGCGSDDLARVEDHMQSVFSDGTLSYEIEAARLTIMRGEGLGISATTP
jgi:heat shock protein HslJ